MMNIQIFENSDLLGKNAATDAFFILNEIIGIKGQANVVMATGTSQYTMLKNLTIDKTIDWSKVTMFHLDENIGLPPAHPASLRKYLTDRFIDKVGTLKEVNFIYGDAADPEAECERLGNKISGAEIDLLFCGIGENSHIAFNDPPADFKTERPYIIVIPDEACRRQQTGEGWFPELSDIPAKAISMSVQQIMKAKNIICCVPEKRKTEAVKNCIGSEVSNARPASILQNHSNCLYYFDKDSASLLSRNSFL